MRTAGLAIVRQRPGTAKGFCFITLEDETGMSNGVLTPALLQPPAHRELHTAAPSSRLRGPLQNVDDVIHVRVRELIALVPRGHLPRSHDFR